MNGPGRRYRRDIFAVRTVEVLVYAVETTGRLQPDRFLINRRSRRISIVDGIDQIPFTGPLFYAQCAVAGRRQMQHVAR